LLLGLLSGCGKEMNMADGDAMLAEKAEASVPGANTVTDMQLPENQKLIRKIRLTAQTRDLPEMLSLVEQRIAEFGGYVENRDVYNGSAYEDYTSRYASLTVRIPAKSLDDFVEKVSEESNVISASETTENITLSYVATQSRITALETEQTRLLELLEMAKNLDEVLKIETKLTDVREDLEQLNSQLKLYDNQVNYGTVYLKLDEVREYTQVEEAPKGFWERISTGFVKSLKNLGNALLELVIFFISNLPYFVVLAVFVVGFFLIRKWRKKKKQNEQQPPNPQ
jgi:hypothetical protein